MALPRRSLLQRSLGAASVLLLTVFVSSGCEDELPEPVNEPVSPDARIHELAFFPDSVAVGGFVSLFLDVTGENLTIEWTATAGSFIDDEGDQALWKAPDEPVATVRIAAVASNPNSKDVESVEVIVGPYVPRTTPFYLSYVACGECHGADPELALWAGSAHARAFENVGEDANSACFSCHAVGFGDIDSIGRDLNNGGYDEIALERLEGVQCESCHGPLGDRSGTTGIVNDAHTMGDGPHLRRGRDLFGVYDETGAPVGCGACHAVSHQLYGAQWNSSRHSESVRAGVADDPSCTPCHTAQGYLDEFVDGGVAATYGDEAMPVNCVVCHDPHDPTHDGMLREPSADAICADCHTAGDVLPSGALHHTELDVLQARGAVEYAGVTYETSPHAELAPTACTTCHVYTSPFRSPDEPAFTAHDVRPVAENCRSCHSTAAGTGPVGDLDFVQNAREDIESLLGALLSELEAAADTTTQAYRDARFNYRFALADESRGTHNYLYIKSVLETTIDMFNP